jgi:hypothetical protein
MYRKRARVEEDDGALFMDNYSHSYLNRDINTSTATHRRDAKWSGIMFLSNKKKLKTRQCAATPGTLPTAPELFSATQVSNLQRNMWRCVSAVEHTKLKDSVCTVNALYHTPVYWPLDEEGKVKGWVNR